jgi:hypothetical protein
MDTFLLSLGWWNFIGSLMMLAFLYEPFGKKMLNDWTMIFVEEFTLNFWSKLWMAWAAGLNVFFGSVNILAVKWALPELKIFLVISDLAAYLIFMILAIKAYREKKLGSGAYSVFVIFAAWIIWGIAALSV